MSGQGGRLANSFAHTKDRYQLGNSGGDRSEGLPRGVNAHWGWLIGLTRRYVVASKSVIYHMNICCTMIYRYPVVDLHRSWYFLRLDNKFPPNMPGGQSLC